LFEFLIRQFVSAQRFAVHDTSPDSTGATIRTDKSIDVIANAWSALFSMGQVTEPQ